MKRKTIFFIRETKTLIHSGIRECDEINQPQVLVRYFREANESRLNRLFECFFQLFYEEFKQFAFKLCRDKPFSKHKEEVLAYDAFIDGLLTFYAFLREKGFENRGASIKTLFFEFGRNKLLGLVKSLERLSLREYRGDPEEVFAAKSNATWQADQASEEEVERMKEVEIVKEALRQLRERCRDLIRWRKLEKLPNEVIAQRLNIQPGSVNNEVFKCFKKLKELVDKLKGEK